MNIATKRAAKRLIFSLLSITALAGCVAVPYGHRDNGPYDNRDGRGWQHEGQHRDDGRYDDGSNGERPGRAGHPGDYGS